MILEEKVKDVVIVGQHNAKKAAISANKMAKLQYLLTKGLYKDPVTAVIAEWTNNGIDSVVQAGKDPVENPVLVKIEENDKEQYVFRVEDKGTGLDDRDFEDICMNYLESTKEGDNDTIGHFGIGMKSFLSLERSATFDCVKNGIRRKWLVYEGEEFVNYDLLLQEPTDAENGVTAELTIKDWTERNLFITKAQSKLAYYDTAIIIVEGKAVENSIFRNELFQWSTFGGSDLHLTLKDVYYPIDWEALRIRAIPIPVAIKLQLGDGITPTPSRESYITNEKTKNLILKKIEEIANWFFTRYNETVATFNSFYSAFPYIGMSTYNVVLNEKKFDIGSLLFYSKVKPVEVKVDGIQLESPLFYKVNKACMLDDYDMVAYKNHRGIVKSKNRMGISKEYHVFDKAGMGKTVLVADHLRGNVKEYLKSVYPPSTLFVMRNSHVRDISLVRGSSTKSYEMLYNLTNKPKYKWKDYIKEWELVTSHVTNIFVDETKVTSSKGYIDWLEKKREDQKANRLKRTYSGLGKKSGDVTLHYSYERYGRIFFKKDVFPINKLHLNTFLTVLITEDSQIPLAKAIRLSTPDTERIRFALAGKLERKKIPDHYQFINFIDFMSINCKPFLRLASAIKFQETLSELEKIGNYNNGIFRNILKNVKKDRDVLTEYVDKYFNRGVSLDVRNMIIDVADKHDLYDKRLWDAYLRLKGDVLKYDFINLIETPPSYNTEKIKRCENLIYQILLFRKKHKELPEGVKIIFEQIKEKQDVV